MIESYIILTNYEKKIILTEGRGFFKDHLRK